MKNFLRITIVVLVLIGLGLATYMMFFKPANREEVYLTLSKVDEVEEKLEYESALISISKSNFNPASNLNEVRQVLQNYRGFVSEKDGKMTFENYSYPQIKGYMDGVFDYYYAYSQAAGKTIPNHTHKTIKTAVNNYEKSLNELISSINEVKSLHDYILEENNNNSSGELENRYKKLINVYRGYIATYAELISKSRDFVVEYVFNGDMITDKESLMYDLMITSIHKAVSKEYNFDDLAIKNVADDYMKSAINFTNIAIEGGLGGTSIYSYDAKSVEHNGKLYLPNQLEYYMMDELQFKVVKDGNYASLYLGDTDVVLVGADRLIVEVDAVDYVTIKTVSGVDICKQSINNFVTFDCYVDKSDLTKLYFYQGEYSHLDENRPWINLSSPIEITGSQIIFTGKDDKKGSVAYSIEREYYYTIGYNDYKLNENNQLVVISSGTILQNAIYHENNFYTTTNYKDGDEKSIGELLNYKHMIKSYNKIVENDTADIDKIIDLTYEQKVAFVEDREINGVRVRASFDQTLHEDLEYLLACCGFHSLGVNNG